MKTFNQFKHDMNEGVAALAIPVGAGILKKIAASSALKAIGSGALTGGALTGAYLASKKINKDKGEEEIKQRKQAEDEEVGKALGMNPGDKLPQISKVKQNIKSGIKKYKEGLKVAQNPTVAKKYRTPEMGNQTPLEYLKQKFGKQIKKQRDQYRRERKRNSQDKLP